jgi:hypothetical protein
MRTSRIPTLNPPFEKERGSVSRKEAASHGLTVRQLERGSMSRRGAASHGLAVRQLERGSMSRRGVASHGLAVRNLQFAENLHGGPSRVGTMNDRRLSRSLYRGKIIVCGSR